MTPRVTLTSNVYLGSNNKNSSNIGFLFNSSRKNNHNIVNTKLEALVDLILKKPKLEEEKVKKKRQKKSNNICKG